MRRFGLRARLVAALVSVAVATALLASMLASLGLNRSLDSYLERRTNDASASAVALVEAAHAGAGGRWTPQTMDLLGHDLVLTGYDFRLSHEGRILVDTTRLKPPGAGLRRVSTHRVRDKDGREIGTLEMFALGAGGNLPADDELRSELGRAHLVAAGLAAALAIVVGLFIAGRLARPLRRLTHAARALGSGAVFPADPPEASPEVRELGDALRTLSVDLDRQQRLRKRLAQDLSHELRTPLMLLQSRIEAMQDGIVSVDDAGLESVHDETLRLTRLIDRIERLAEAEAAVPPLSSAPIDLEQVATQAYASLVGAFQLQGLRLELDVRPAPAVGDPDAVRQIVLNLLSNALKYASTDEPVRMSCGREGPRSVLRVRNGSDPVASDESTRLFDRLRRGARAHDHGEGAGLGLSIARELAEAQGGSLRHEDAGTGTVLALRLPVAASLRPAVAGAPGSAGTPAD